MSLITFGLILTNVILNACVQLLLKAGVNNIGRSAFSIDNILPIGTKLATQWFIIRGLSCCVISMIVWIPGLSCMDVTITYPTLLLGYIVNAFLAWYLLGEVLLAQRLIGTTVVLTGVLALAHS